MRVCVHLARLVARDLLERAFEDDARGVVVVQVHQKVDVLQYSLVQRERDIDVRLSCHVPRGMQHAQGAAACAAPRATHSPRREALLSHAQRARCHVACDRPQRHVANNMRRGAAHVLHL